MHWNGARLSCAVRKPGLRRLIDEACYPSLPFKSAPPRHEILCGLRRVRVGGGRGLRCGVSPGSGPVDVVPPPCGARPARLRRPVCGGLRLPALTTIRFQPRSALSVSLHADQRAACTAEVSSALKNRTTQVTEAGAPPAKKNRAKLRRGQSEVPAGAGRHQCSTWPLAPLRQESTGFVQRHPGTGADPGPAADEGPPTTPFLQARHHRTSCQRALSRF